MRILILTPRLPWPALDGGRVAMSRLAQSLANRGAEVEVLSLNPRKHRGVAEGPVPIRAIDIDTSRVAAPLLRALLSLLPLTRPSATLSPLTRGEGEITLRPAKRGEGARSADEGSVPFIVARFFSPEYQTALNDTLRRFQPDIVQIESPFLLPYAPKNIPTVLRSLNVEFRIWERLAKTSGNPLYRRIAASLRRYEIREMNKLDAIIPISEDDAADFRALGCTAPMYVVPCGVNLPTHHSRLTTHATAGFIGSLDYRPNQDAVLWIVKELWPKIVERVPEAKLSIAGSSPPEWLRREVEKHGLTLQANVPDPHAFVESLSVVLAPIRAGGGMRIKILEAMAAGKPVVATTLGASGMNAKDVVIADDAGSFADAVARLLRDPADAARRGAAGREHVAREYDSDALATGLLKFYEGLLRV